LSTPTFPAGKCVTPNASSAVASPGAGVGGKKPPKYLEMKKNRISVGAAAYFFD